MKKLALSSIAATLALAAFTAPASALDQSNDTKVDTQVVAINGNVVTLSNGIKLERNSFALPTHTPQGDKVRAIYNEDNELKRVMVLG